MSAPALQSAGSPPLPEAMPWDAFIAHASGDADAAKALFTALRDGGCRPFLDSECLELGCDWDTELAKAQRQSSITVVLVSGKTPRSHFQREEIQAAIALAREPETRHRVVPVWLDGMPAKHDLVPYGLRIKHGIALGRKVTLEVVAARLIALIHRRPPIKTPGPVPPFFALIASIASLPRFALLGAAAAAILAVRVLGQLSHDARESILGVPLDLTSYPEGELWQTGLRAAGGLITSALFELWAGEGVELWGAPVAAALAVGWVLLARSRFQRASLVLLPAAAVALVVAVLAYAIAVKVTHVVVPGGAESPCVKATTLTDRVTFEVCSWLENGTEVNGRRRAALEGLWGWLFAAVCTAGVCSARKWSRERAGAPRHLAVMHGILGATCVIAALFLLRQAPRAYALGAWGLKYSRIVNIEEPCLPELREGLMSEECRVWDVSAGAREQILVLLGKGCGAGVSSNPILPRARVLPRSELTSCGVEVREGHIFGER